jgi:hypothetical protein
MHCHGQVVQVEWLTKDEGTVLICNVGKLIATRGINSPEDRSSTLLSELKSEPCSLILWWFDVQQQYIQR